MLYISIEYFNEIKNQINQKYLHSDNKWMKLIFFK